MIYQNQTISDFLLNIQFYFPPIEEAGWAYYIVNGILFFIVYNSLHMIYILLRNKQLAFVSKKWDSAEKKDVRILILGDSTAVGTGADSKEATIAGRLAHDFPDAQIVNLGKNGGLIKDVSTQVTQVMTETFDMIIISVGGNDVWHMTRSRTIKKHLTYILSETKRMSNQRVLFLIYNNIGDAPLFPQPIRYFLKIRGEHIHHLIKTVAVMLHVPIIELFVNPQENPFLKNPEKLFAGDGIHPSSRGYEVWYNRMWREMVRSGFRFTK